MKRGGKRNNSGRKPVSDKKVQVSLYIKQSEINNIGGMDEFKKEVLKYIKTLSL